MTITLRAGSSNDGAIQVNGTDLITFSADVASAASGKVLEANSGPDDSQLSGYRNKIINGGMWVSQRGTGFSLSTATYIRILDRWYIGIDTSGSVAINQVFANDVPYNDTGTYMRLQGTALVGCFLSTAIESVRTFAGKTVVLSYYENLASGTDTGAAPYLVQYFGSGGSANVAIAATSDVTTNSRRVLTYSVPSIAGKTLGAGHYLNVVFPLGGTFDKHISSVQLEEGGLTPFETRSYAEDLKLCQRYYEISQASLRAYATGASQQWDTTVSFNTSKRVVPTLSASGGVVLNINSAQAFPSGVSNYRFNIIATAAGETYSIDTVVTAAAEL